MDTLVYNLPSLKWGLVFLLDFLCILGTWSLWKFITLIGPLAEVWL